MKRADGMKISSAQVEITVDKSTIGQHSNYTRVYSTDAHGQAFITIPPFIAHELRITVSILQEENIHWNLNFGYFADGKFVIFKVCLF